MGFEISKGKWASLLLATVLMLLSAGASAQVLEPGDELKIRIPPSRALVNVTIDANGVIDVKGYGSVKVGGLSPAEAQRALRRYLGRFVKNAAGATLKLHKAGRLVLVTGGVVKPGMVRIGKRDDLWRAISEAGGPAPGADLTRVVLARKKRRGGTVKETVHNVAAYLSGNRDVEMPMIKSGDTIFVPTGGVGTGPNGPSAVFLSESAVANKVFVLGAVSRPGMYNRSPGLSALAALALAGGPTPGADLSNLRVTTKDSVVRVDIASWLEGESAERPALPDAGGVIVYVPTLPTEKSGNAGLGRHVNVVGGTAQSGRVAVRGEVSLVDLVAMAGGAAADSDLTEVKVVHRGPSYTIATKYDLEQFMNEGGLVSQVVLKPGDAVFIDKSTAAEVWRNVVGVISDLAAIATAFALFSTLSTTAN